ncbi:chaplin family protein [Actinoplanes sp. NPDC048791]|uniref:chaplin family protein n=1 Tax=Actinoplanes sp. NPDC048791 TaxID=3154623 RepID=UPI0033D9E847
MKTWVRKTLSVGVLAAGALLFAPGAAQADVSQDSSGNVGILNGTQVFAPIAVPLNVVGNSIGVAGEANSAGSGINFVESGQHRKRGGKGGVSQNTSGNFGIANGTQAYLPISVPVNVVGNSAAVLGLANASGAGVNHVESTKVEHGKGNRGGRGGRGADQNSSGNFGVLNGTQVYAPVDVPINLCGNALSILGLAQSQAACVNGDGGGHRRESTSQDTSGNYGIANGTQVYAPISAPLNIAGNSIGVAGEANSAAVAKNESARGHDFSQDSSRNVGILNGTQLAAPISIPINVCGNSLAVLGLANSAAACANDVDVDGDRGHGHGHKGNGGDNGHGHNGNGGDNGGKDDDDYVAGDDGVKDDGYGNKDDDDVAGDAGNQDDKYGKPARKSTQEAGAVDGLTQNLSNAGGLNVGGLNVLDTLGK